MLGVMDVQSPPTIFSFVIRFVVEPVSTDTPLAAAEQFSDAPPSAGQAVPNAPASSYRGSIRHIQTEEELNFSTWEDAVAFIRRFVPLDSIPDDIRRQLDR